MTLIVIAGWTAYPRAYDELPLEVRKALRFYLTPYEPGVLNPFKRYDDYYERERIPARYMLDSGAYSAFTKGIPLTVEGYAEWIKSQMIERHKTLEDFWPVTLDVIPGRWGVQPTQKERERAIEVTIENTFRLRDEFGLRVIPVQHRGEPLELFDRYLEAGFDYLGVAPVNDTPFPEKLRYLQQVFRYLQAIGCRLDSWPALHVFGNISPAALRSIPAYTADAITWVTGAKFGHAHTRGTGFQTFRSLRIPDPGVSLMAKKYHLMRQGLLTLLDLQNHVTDYWDRQGVRIVEPHFEVPRSWATDLAATKEPV